MVELADDTAPTDYDRLEQAESVVRAYCGWHIAPSRTEVVSYVCEGNRHIILPTLYVTAVSSVTVDGVALDPADYTLTESGVLTRRGTTSAAVTRWWCDWWGTVVVSFTHGYESVPPEVTGVVQSLAQRAVNSGRALIQVGAVQYGETSTAAVGSEAEILNRYRLSSIA